MSADKSGGGRRWSFGQGWAGLRPVIGKAALAVVLMGALTFLLLALAGVFRAKVPHSQVLESGRSAAGLPITEVRLVTRPRLETAVGTIRPVHETAVASKLLAKVVQVHVKAGQVVSEGEVLVRLDDRDLQARLQQAEAALAAAKSAEELALADFRRAESLYQRKVIAEAEFDRYRAASLSATAERQRAEQAVREAAVLLDYTVVRAPISGIVVDKRVEEGDTVVPGQVLLTLYDPTRMQMVVTVRESLAQRLAVGQSIRGTIEALGYECDAKISEIVPETQTPSRSFTVKVTGPCPAGVYSGMFGRIFIPLDDEQVVVVPEAAVVKVGQLDMVDVVVDGVVRRRAVQLGRSFDGQREVLAGLAPGERVILARQDGEVGR